VPSLVFKPVHNMVRSVGYFEGRSAVIEAQGSQPRPGGTMVLAYTNRRGVPQSARFLRFDLVARKAGAARRVIGQYS
jgi:hypothetical protein